MQIFLPPQWFLASFLSLFAVHTVSLFQSFTFYGNMHLYSSIFSRSASSSWTNLLVYSFSPWTYHSSFCILSFLEYLCQFLCVLWFSVFFSFSSIDSILPAVYFYNFYSGCLYFIDYLYIRSAFSNTLYKSFVVLNFCISRCVITAQYTIHLTNSSFFLTNSTSDFLCYAQIFVLLCILYCPNGF